jgi:hypothetical protein
MRLRAAVLGIVLFDVVGFRRALLGITLYPG